MTLTELKYIIAASETLNFGRAAEKCFVSQPTLSIGIKKLEDQLGVQIFERQKSEVRLTPIGKTLVEQAKKIWQETRKFKELASEGQDPLSGMLALGAIYTVGPYLFPRIIPLLQESAPSMPLMLHEGFTRDLRRQLVTGELDMIIVAAPFTEPGVICESLYKEELKVILPANHHWATHKTINPAQLNEENLLLLGDAHCFRDDVLRACPPCTISAHANTDEEKMTEGSSLETIRHMVASGMGISILPESAINAALYAPNYFLVKSFSGIAPTREILIAYRENYPRHAVIDLLHKLLDT